jgi:16S rRNA processing protein RimM
LIFCIKNILKNIKGYLKIINYADDIKDLERYDITDTNNTIFKINIIRNIKKNIFIAKINDICDRNEAENICNIDLFLNKDQLEDLSDGEFYQCDLMGMKILFDNKEVGIIDNILNFGSQDLIEIQFYDKNFCKNENIFPFNDSFFGKIDLEDNNVILKKIF